MKTGRQSRKLLKASLLSILILAMTAFSSTSVMARWSYLIAMSGSMTVKSSGMATITAECRANYQTVDSVKVTCELQRLDGTWQTLKSWTESADKNLILFSKNYAIYKNYSYRLKVTSYAYNGNTLLESASEYYTYGYYN